jgi:hypothetical protein
VVPTATFGVEGEATSAFVRLATIADLSNGNAQALDARRFIVTNPVITLQAHRLSESEWVGMRSEAHQHTSGIGLADTAAFDVTGLLGRISQAQLIDHQPAR